jgi:hypothetical protein
LDIVVSLHIWSGMDFHFDDFDFVYDAHFAYTFAPVPLSVKRSSRAASGQSCELSRARRPRDREMARPRQRHRCDRPDRPHLDIHEFTAPASASS